jgi:hypothetical protein
MPGLVSCDHMLRHQKAGPGRAGGWLHPPVPNGSVQPWALYAGMCIRMWQLSHYAKQHPRASTRSGLNNVNKLGCAQLRMRFVVRGFKEISENSLGGPTSNWVSVLVPSPTTQRPSTLPFCTPATPYHILSRPNDREVTDTPDSHIATYSTFGLNLLDLLVIGCAALFICTAVCCLVRASRTWDGNSGSINSSPPETQQSH